MEVTPGGCSVTAWGDAELTRWSHTVGFCGNNSAAGGGSWEDAEPIRTAGVLENAKTPRGRARVPGRADGCRSPARGPQPGSCCLRRDTPIHSRPSCPYPSPGGAREPRGTASWRLPVHLGAGRRSHRRRGRSACQPPPALDLSAWARRRGAAGSHAPGGCHGGAGQRLASCVLRLYCPQLAERPGAILGAGIVTHFRSAIVTTGSGFLSLRAGNEVRQATEAEPWPDGVGRALWSRCAWGWVLPSNRATGSRGSGGIGRPGWSRGRAQGLRVDSLSCV